MFALCRPKYQGSTPSGTPGNFGQKSPTPCWFERRIDIQSQIAAEWLQTAQPSQWRAYETTIALSNGAIAGWPPTTSPSPKWRFHLPPRYANGHISATGDPIHFMFGSRVGFSGSAVWRYFRLHQIQFGGRPPSWIISNGHISATAHLIHLYGAYLAVIFAIVQLSCHRS